MAPFNTHFLIAEKIWPVLPGPWQAYYGQFAFGCVAPDVDKVSATLTQRDTHFFDRTSDYDLMATHRSATFLAGQAKFLGQPFANLPPEAQAFVLGYLCHLCVDEVSKHLWRRDTWLQFQDIGPGPAFAALDECAQQQTQNYEAIVTAIGSLDLVEVIPVIPRSDLSYFYQGVYRFTRTNSTEEAYLTLVDMVDQPSPEQREHKRQHWQAYIGRARQQIHLFEVTTLVEAGLAHSYRRLTKLIQGNTAEPGYPDLNRRNIKLQKRFRRDLGMGGWKLKGKIP